MHGSLKITRRRGGQVLSFVTGLLATVSASANPQGAQVVSGSAVFANPTPQTLEITNSPAAVLNWQSFDIGKNEVTRFIQQNAASTVLNRVTTGNSSEILGSLVSNGHVFLINPAGILIGKTGSVDTAGVVLSTLQITNEDFLAGRFHFEGENSDGAVTNHGYIKTAPGGEVVLIAPRIENAPEGGAAKSGLIESPNGDLVLAAGSSITIASLDDPDITFEVRAPDNEVVNLGRLLARGGTASVLAGTIRHSGEINADTVSSDGQGRISLRASNRIGLAEGSSVHARGSDGETGGTISIDARNDEHNGNVDLLGTVVANGDKGGKITVQGDNVLIDGVVSARGSTTGGSVVVKSTEATITTAGAALQVNGTDGHGGGIIVDGGKNTFASGTMRASGKRGGSVTVLGDEVTLAATQINADGSATGGRVRVGGGFRGGEDLHAAASVAVNDSTRISASASKNGNGGDVVVWADGATRFAGNILARGGADGGDGGRVEVSGRAGLGFTGTVDVTARNGDAGTLLLDPKNIRFTAEELPAAPLNLLDPHPGADNLFGDRLEYFDANGNRVDVSNATTVVVYDFLDDFGGADAGAVYVYRLSDGALLSGLHGLTGSASGDRVGNEFLSSVDVAGKYLLRSRLWGGGAGALTVFDPVNGTSGAVDASSSLVGAAPGDDIGGSFIRPLGGNSVAVVSPSFNSNRGAITMVTPDTLRGTVSTSISLVGANQGDRLGADPRFNTHSLQDLGGGNWAVRSDNGGFGSITILHAGAPVKGVVGANNSLIGDVSGDAIGDDGLLQLGNSNIWRTTSTLWHGGKGAVTWIDSTTTPKGVVDGSNSLLGVAVGDLGNGNARFSSLGAGRLLLFSENGGAGAVTYVNPTSLPVGLVDSSNSLVGSLSTDQIGHNVNGGSRNFDILGNKFVIYSPKWNLDAGAVTFGDVTTGLTPGVVSLSTSLIGASSGDRVGDAHILTFGARFGLLKSGGGGAGAITPIDTLASMTGTVDSSNSLVGVGASDNIGGDGINLLEGSTVAIISSHWTAPGAKADAGAVTLFDAATGTFNGTAVAMAGQISITNSLVGTEANDLVGGAGVSLAYVDANGQFVFAVQSPDWANTPSVPRAGALTWFKQTDSLIGDVPSTNSLFGASTDDQVGSSVPFINGLGFSSSGVYQISSGNFGNAIVYVPTFNNGAGAIVHIDGSVAPPTGVISASNALIGSTAGDEIGSGGILDIGSGKYIVLSPKWDNFSSADAGAITIVDANAGVTGAVGSANSLIGDQFNDRLGAIQPNQLDTGSLLFRTPTWHGGTGAVTFVNLSSGQLLGDTDFGATLSSSNSLVGDRAGDNVGANGSLSEITFGKYVLLSPDVSEFNGPQHVGAATYFSDSVGVAGQIDSTNSLVGTHANDRVGSDGLFSLFNGNMLVLSGQWNGNAGAVTFLDGNTGHFGGSIAGVLNGALDQTNSLVGRTGNDSVGSEDIQRSFAGTGYYMVFSPLVDNTNTSAVDAGAVTFGDILQGVRGFADDNTVSFVGTAANDLIGDNANTDSTNNQNVFLINPQWHGNFGAVTFVDLVNGTGLSGDIDSLTNSVTGTSAGDKVGIGGVQMLSNHVAAIRSPNWTDGGTFTDAGAITWVSELTGGHGDVTASTSLVGTHDFDAVGNSFISFVGGTNSLFVVRTAGFDGNKSALTFVDTAGVTPKGNIDGLSLLGSTANDGLGNAGVFAVSQGATRRVVVLSPDWDNGVATNAGAITTFLESSPKVGAIDSTNSLVGTHATDAIGDGNRVALTNGNQLLVHSNWNADRGAVTFWNVSSDLVGNVGPANSLVGASSGDRVGLTQPQELFGTNRYVVQSREFNANAGALSFGTITSGVRGTMGPVNSLVGANSGDFFGSSVSPFSFFNGPVLILSNHGGRGAATYVDPRNPARGEISAANSLVGSTVGDGIGFSEQFVTSNLRAIKAPGWDNGAAVDAGAIAMIDLTTGKFAGTNTPFAGRISAANSLVGTFTGDRVGDTSQSSPIETFSIGQKSLGAVFTGNWNEGRGAITWFTPGEQLAGEITASNSVVGTFVNDHVGGGFSFSQVQFFHNPGALDGAGPDFGAIFTPTWNASRGAITWFNPNAPLVGEITAENSLIGSFSNDQVGGGFFSQVQFFNTSTLPPSPAPAFGAVFSPNWNGNRGAITWFKPGELPVGKVTARNSLVGAFVDDFVGGNFDESSSHGMIPLPTGNFVLHTPTYNSDGGAVTFLNVARGLPVGQVTAGNSFVGSPGSRIGSRDVRSMGGDRVFIVSPNATVGGLLNAGRLDILDGSKTQAVDAIDPITNLDDELAVSIPAVVRFLNSGGALSLQASNDILLPQGFNIIASAGALSLDAGNDIAMDGDISMANFTAQAGNDIQVNGNISLANGGSLILNSGHNINLNGNTTLGEGGALTILAGNDILLPAGVRLFAEGGTSTLQAGRSIEVKGDIFTTGALKLFANTPNGDTGKREAGEGFVSVLADTKSSSIIAGELEVDAEDVLVQGGNAKGAYALLYGLDTVKINAHGSGTVSLKAGVGEELPPLSIFELEGLLSPKFVLNGNPVVLDAPVAMLVGGKSLDVEALDLIEITGGGSVGAFAAMASFGEFKAHSQDIQLHVGTADNTDALFLGFAGVADVTFTTCTGCGDVLADPLLDVTSQTGTFLAGLFSEPTIAGVLSNVPADLIKPGVDGDDEPATEEEDEKKKEASTAECH